VNVKTIVLDSHALFAYFEKEPGWEAVAEVLQEASDNKVQLAMTRVNWGEVYYVTLREYGEESAEAALEALRNMPVEIVEITDELTIQAARFKAKGGISYSDCFSAALAKIRKGSELLTGDKEFKRVEDEVKIRWVRG
jgi:predicted nucleic acid-binding protein